MLAAVESAADAGTALILPQCPQAGRANRGGRGRASGDEASGMPSRHQQAIEGAIVAKISDVMTPDPITLDVGEPIIAAARAMKERDVGDVVVQENGKVRGIVTDRDIVVRAVAEGRGPQEARLGEVCSSELAWLSPDADVADAVRLMREKSVRRLPVLSDDRPVGIVSLGDLAIEQDFESVLGEISSAPGNT